MPELTDIADIRARLEADRSWSLYALGDLMPEQRPHCRWFGAADGALALLFRAFDVPVFFALGAPASLHTLLPEIDEPEIFALVRPDFAPFLAKTHTLHPQFMMWRMILNPDLAPHVSTGAASLLTPEDLPALGRLYEDDERQDGDPRFFTASMLEHGVYYGVREGAELISAAGTHLVAPSEGVGALGNVYTRRDRRGRGLAQQTVGAVTAHLTQMKLRTIGLNVAQENTVAIRLYERLGFTRYCPYVETHATAKRPN